MRTRDSLIKELKDRERPMTSCNYEHYCYVMDEMPELEGNEELKDVLAQLELANPEDTYDIIKATRSSEKPPKTKWWWWIDKL